jgi:hypothetical protein
MQPIQPRAAIVEAEAARGFCDHQKHILIFT